MTVQINDFTITEFLDFEAYKRDTGELDFKLEEMQEFTLNATQDKTERTGKNGDIIGYKKHNKSANGEGTYAMVSAGLMAVQTGGDVILGTHKVKKSEFKFVSGTTITTNATAVGTANAEIGVIKVLNANGSVVERYEQAATADATHFSYDPASKTITLPTDGGTVVIEDGTKILYAYYREVEGTKVTNPAGKFSLVREVWVHCFGEDACGNEFYASIYIPRADFSGEFALNVSGDQVVHNFSFGALKDICAAQSGTDTNLFELIVYTDEGVAA